MNPATKCRRATTADQDVIWRVRTASIRTLCKDHYGERQTEAWASEPPPDDFAEVIRSHDFHVAECEGTVAGFGFINRQSAILEAIFVAPEFARRGVGTALLTALERSARQAGLSHLNLSSSLNAVGFYENAGYCAIEQTIWHHPAAFDLPCVAMSKDLM